MARPLVEFIWVLDLGPLKTGKAGVYSIGFSAEHFVGFFGVKSLEPRCGDVTHGTSSVLVPSSKARSP